MAERANLVVIGGGIMGLATAYNLARVHRMDKVVVLEQSYLCSGASGRNGGGVRAQFSSETNVRLMQESLRICKDFAETMNINVWFRQGGYLFLVRDSAAEASLVASVGVQNACGHPTRLLSPREAKRIVPELSTEGVLSASFNPHDAVVFPWPFVWGYAKGAADAGVSVRTFTKVIGIDLHGSKIVRVRTNQGDIECSRVVNACGAWSPEIAAMVGVSLPNRPHRHEICSSEPLKPWLTPLVADLSNGLYFSQSTRGEIVGGISNHHVPEGIDMRSSTDFLGMYSRGLMQAIPALGNIKILRQWAGVYDLTPDQNPIVGEVDEVDDFYQVSGFTGHGFMMAPVMGKLLAQHIARSDDQPLFRRWNLRRFKEGRLLTENMIIG